MTFITPLTHYLLESLISPLPQPHHPTPLPTKSYAINFGLWPRFPQESCAVQEISIHPGPTEGIEVPLGVGRFLYNQNFKEMYEFPEWLVLIRNPWIGVGKLFSGNTQFIMAAQVLISKKCLYPVPQLYTISFK